MLKKTDASNNEKILKLFFIDYLFIFLILGSSFTIYIHHLFPDRPIWSTDFFVLEPKVAGSVQIFIYIVLLKLSPILLFSTWYITETRWWKFSILSPILYLSYQLVTQIFLELGMHEASINLYSVPYVILFLLVLLGFNLSLKYYKKNLVHNYNIDSDNFYQLPRTTKEHRRIKVVKDILDEENLNRTQLNLIYKEYNLLGHLNQEFNSNKSSFDLISGFKTFFEILFFIILLFTPLFFNIYQIISPGIESVNIYGIIIPSFGFRDLQTFLWVINSKLLMIIPVTLWFFTSRYWWKYFLLIPFSISVFQLIEMFKDSSKMDGAEIFVIFPLVVLITGVMVFLTGRVRKYVMLLEFYYKMEQKINNSILTLSMDKSDERSSLKKELTELIKEHKKYPPEEYLRRLKAIKGRLEELKEQEY